MHGFFETGAIQKLHESINSTEGCCDSNYFINAELTSFVKLEPLGSYGDFTYLANALQKAMEKRPSPSIIWMVTDNQPSLPGSEDHSQQDITKFYALLHSEKIKRIHLFPLKLRYKGILYRADGSVPLVNNYDDLRGLLVYGLLLNESARDEFEKSVKTLEERLSQQLNNQNFSRILIKPLSQDTMRAELHDGSKLKVENGGIVGRDFSEGEPIDGDFKVRLTSELGQIKIDYAEITAAQAGQFETNDFLQHQMDPSITPREFKNFGPNDSRECTVALHMDSVHMRQSLTSYWKSLFRNRGDIKGNIQLAIKVKVKNLSTTSGILNAFSTGSNIYNDPSPATQSKIYLLNNLVGEMISQSKEEVFTIYPRVGANKEGLIPVHLSVRLPKIAAWIIGALMLLALLIPLAMILWIARQPRYRLTWNHGMYRACEDFRLWPFTGRPIEIDDRRAATIRKNLFGIKVNAVRDHTVDETRTRIVQSNGAEFNISRRDDGAGVTFNFSKAGVLAKKNPKAVDPIFGGDGAGTIDYGGDADLSNPPIRKPTTGVKLSDSSRRTAPGASVTSPPSKQEGGGKIDYDDLFK